MDFGTIFLEFFTDISSFLFLEERIPPMIMTKRSHVFFTNYLGWQDLLSRYNGQHLANEAARDNSELDDENSE